MIETLLLIWYLGGLAYACWAWRLEFDLTLGPFLFAIVFCVVIGPFLGLAWQLSWYFEHNPMKIPTITILKRKPHL